MEFHRQQRFSIRKYIIRSHFCGGTFHNKVSAVSADTIIANTTVVEPSVSGARNRSNR